MNLIGRAVTTVVVMLDAVGEKVGFWFFRNHIDAPRTCTSGVYAISNPKDPLGSRMIRCKKLLDDTPWLKKKLKALNNNIPDLTIPFLVIIIGLVIFLIKKRK